MTKHRLYGDVLENIKEAKEKWGVDLYPSQYYEAKSETWFSKTLSNEYFKDLFEDVSRIEYEKSLAEMKEELEGIYKEYGDLETGENIEEYKELLQLWANSYGRNILHLVSYLGYPRYASFRLHYKSSLEEYVKKDDFGFTPMDYAEHQGHTEIIEMLKEFEKKRVKK